MPRRSVGVGLASGEGAVARMCVQGTPQGMPVVTSPMAGAWPWFPVGPSSGCVPPVGQKGGTLLLKPASASTATGPPRGLPAASSAWTLTSWRVVAGTSTVKNRTASEVGGTAGGCVNEPSARVTRADAADRGAMPTTANCSSSYGWVAARWTRRTPSASAKQAAISPSSTSPQPSRRSSRRPRGYQRPPCTQVRPAPRRIRVAATLDAPVLSGARVGSSNTVRAGRDTVRAAATAPAPAAESHLRLRRRRTPSATSLLTTRWRGSHVDTESCAGSPTFRTPHRLGRSGDRIAAPFRSTEVPRSGAVRPIM